MFKKHRPPVGARPGTLVAVEEAVAPRIHVIDYTQDAVNESDLSPSDLSNLVSHRDSKSATWIDIQGLGDLDLLRQLGELFGIHPLALEDVVNIPQRPKAEEFENSVFIVTCMITAPSLPQVDVEQMSLFIGGNFVITFQEKYGDIFDQIRKRIRQGKGPIRKSGNDYLAYAIMDAVIDAYYPVLENLGEYLEGLESEVIENPSKESLQSIYQVPRELLTLRRSIFPQRELINSLIRDGNKIFKKATNVYLRDCYDHCAQVIDVLETYREVCSGLMDVYLSGVSNKMNEVMKVLTIIATIFIPLSFLAGVYGMNFQHMPELGFKWAYPAFWALVLLLGTGMLYFFRRIRWIEWKKTSTDKDITSKEQDST